MRAASAVAVAIATTAIAPVAWADLGPGPSPRPPPPCTLKERAKGRDCEECRTQVNSTETCGGQDELGRAFVCSRGDDEPSADGSTIVEIWCKGEPAPESSEKSGGCNASGASAGALSALGLATLALVRRRRA